jgi:hypothetical protein
MKMLYIAPNMQRAECTNYNRRKLGKEIYGELLIDFRYDEQGESESASRVLVR